MTTFRPRNQVAKQKRNKIIFLSNFIEDYDNYKYLIINYFSPIWNDVLSFIHSIRCECFITSASSKTS